MKYLRKYKIPIIIFVFSFLLMFFCTFSSPLYKFNGWCDINAYYTMGKGLFNGKVLYRDLFDHKGPLLYLIYGICYLISNTTHFGLYIMESIFMGITLYYAYKIANIFLNKKYAFIAMLILPIFLLNFRIVSLGGSAEQFVLAFLMVSLYCFLKICTESLFEKKFYFLLGICSASIILIKFNIIFFVFGLLIYLPILLFKQKKFKEILKVIFWFILGFLIILIPFMLYFIFTRSFGDFWSVYIKFNSLYANLQFNKKGLRTFIFTVDNIKNSFIVTFLISIFGILSFTFSKNNKVPKYSILTSYLLTLFFTYASGRSSCYFYLAFMPFVFIGIINIVKFFDNKRIENNQILILTIFAFILTISSNSNYHSSRIYKPEKPIQITVAEVLKKYDNPTLLEYKIMDLGFYLPANIIPEKYFYIPNISYDVYPKVYDEQDKYLKSGKIDFVITCQDIDKDVLPHEENKILMDNYKLYKNYNDYSNRYILYIRKDLKIK